MDHFLDEAARILASPVPRRRALKLLGGALVAGLFGAARAGAQRGGGCKANETACAPAGKDQCCKANQQCCPGNGAPFCATQAKQCCGAAACNPNQTCCGSRCCNPNQTCNTSTMRCESSNGRGRG